jgi:SAM-dependent methyltransferase
MRSAVKYFSWQSSLVGPELGSRVLEVGCGLGNFTGTLLDREQIVAVDLEPECVARLKVRYPNRANLHAAVCDVLSPEFAALARFRPDTCICLNVLEHIEDHDAALKAMASVLTHGGAIVLMVPAFQALYGPIDKNLGHYRRYNRESMRRLAERAGLKLRKAHYSNLIGFFGWWTNSHILKREAQSPGQIEVFDRFVVPVLSAVEGVVRPPFGQSLVAVLEKP